jgi:hypothetical protein
MISIRLDFGNFTCYAELFDTEISRKFADNLPYYIDLTSWGDELYGPIGLDFGEDDPVEKIPEGGLAYTRTGNLFCIFFGQKPAWKVEYIGKILDDGWKRLKSSHQYDTLVVRLHEEESHLH